MILLFSDTHRFPMGKASVSKFLRAQLQSLGLRLISRQVARFKIRFQYDPWAGLVSPNTLRYFAQNHKHHVESYSQHFSDYVENVDFSVLHRFADELDQKAKALGSESGLVTEGQSVFRLLEPRWNDHLLTDAMVYIDMVIGTLKKYPKATVTVLTDGSLIEKAALTLAKERGHKIELLPSWASRALSRIQDTDHKAKRKQAYNDLTRYWKHFATGTQVSKTESRTQKPRVLFVGYKDRTLRRLEAIAPRLIQDFGYEVFLLGNMKGYDVVADETSERIKNLGVRTFWLSEYLSPTEIKEIETRTIQSLKTSWPEIEKDFPELSYKGVNLHEPAKALIRDAALNGSAPATMFTTAASRAIEALKPSIVVHFEEWEPNRAITLAAQVKKIPSVTYQTFSPAAYVGVLRRLTQACAAPGEFLAKAFSANWPKHRIQITGDPLVDHLSQIDRKKEREHFCRQYGLSDGHPLCMILSTYPDDLIDHSELARIYATMVSAVNMVGGKLVIKAHPQTALSDVSVAFKDAGAIDPIIIHNADLVKLSAAMDIALMVQTSAANSVIMAGTPLVSIQPFHAQDQLEKIFHYQSIAKIPVLDPSENLTACLKDLLSNPSLREEQTKQAYKYVVDHVGPLDGKASQRFGDFLRSELHSSETLK